MNLKRFNLEMLRFKNNENNQNYLLYQKISFLRGLLIPLYFLISFFEYPNWCYVYKDNSHIIHCDQNIMTFGIPFINVYLYRFLELFIICLIISINLLLRTKVKINKKSFFFRRNFLLVLFGICIIDIFQSVITMNYPKLNLLLRGFIFIVLW